MMAKRISIPSAIVYTALKPRVAEMMQKMLTSATVKAYGICVTA